MHHWIKPDVSHRELCVVHHATDLLCKVSFRKAGREDELGELDRVLQHDEGDVVVIGGGDVGPVDEHLFHLVDGLPPILHLRVKLS